MKIKRILAAAIALTIGTSFTECLKKSDSKDFNVGYLNSIAHLLAFVAKEVIYYCNEVEQFKNQPDCRT